MFFNCEDSGVVRHVEKVTLELILFCVIMFMKEQEEECSFPRYRVSVLPAPFRITSIERIPSGQTGRVLSRIKIATVIALCVWNFFFVFVIETSRHIRILYRSIQKIQFVFNAVSLLEV